MTGRTHIVGGIASLWIALPVLALIKSQQEAIGLLVIGGFLGSLLPDLDCVDATLSRFSLRFGQLRFRPFALPSLVLNRTLGHRGALHSLTGICLLLLAIGMPFLSVAGDTTVWFLIGLSLGAISHLLLDACTMSGIPLFWPEAERWHLLPRPLRIVTGSMEEELAFVLLAALALLLLTRLVVQNVP